MIREIRIDDELWDAASRSRREDWRTTISELLQEGELGSKEHRVLGLAIREPELVFRLQGDREEHHVVATGSLAGLVGEYLFVIRRMQDEDTAESSARMEALDMAKKVVHDKGAKLLAEAAPKLAGSHETYRRLFTLVLSILVDVTALPGANAHRRHAAD